MNFENDILKTILTNKINNYYKIVCKEFGIDYYTWSLKDFNYNISLNDIIQVSLKYPTYFANQVTGLENIAVTDLLLTDEELKSKFKCIRETNNVIENSENIEYIINNFNFSKVFKVMEFLNWEYYDGPVTIQRLKDTAKSLLYYAVNNEEQSTTYSTGGFSVYKDGKFLELSFNLTQSDNESILDKQG
jgi:hypothetical protein